MAKIVVKLKDVNESYLTSSGDFSTNSKLARIFSTTSSATKALDNIRENRIDLNGKVVLVGKILGENE